jgi:hypothetical protein
MSNVWRRREVHTGFWWGNLKERGHLEDLDVDGLMLYVWILKRGWTFVQWIDLTLGRDKCHTLMHTVINIRVA